MVLYVLKGDTQEFDYKVFDVYTTMEKLIQAATDRLAFDYDEANFDMEEYGFSGLVYYPLEADKNSDGTKKEIYWDDNHITAYLK